MTKPDFPELKDEGRQFWQGLSTPGKVALGIVVLAVYGAGWLTGGATIGWIIKAVS
jgi:hypothetical protein